MCQCRNQLMPQGLFPTWKLHFIFLLSCASYDAVFFYFVCDLLVRLFFSQDHLETMNFTLISVNNVSRRQYDKRQWLKTPLLSLLQCDISTFSLEYWGLACCRWQLSDLQIEWRLSGLTNVFIVCKV